MATTEAEEDVDAGTLGGAAFGSGSGHYLS
jgi:hypothetical protein